jgi:3-hydroxyisobutyrate dehydrogenase
MFDIVAKSSGQSWSDDDLLPLARTCADRALESRNYDGGFATAMMLKDLKLAQDAAAKVGATTPLGAQTEALFQMFNRPRLWWTRLLGHPADAARSA